MVTLMPGYTASCHEDEKCCQWHWWHPVFHQPGLPVLLTAKNPSAWKPLPWGYALPCGRHNNIVRESVREGRAGRILVPSICICICFSICISISICITYLPQGECSLLCHCNTKAWKNEAKKRSRKQLVKDLYAALLSWFHYLVGLSSLDVLWESLWQMEDAVVWICVSRHSSEGSHSGSDKC